MDEDFLKDLQVILEKKIGRYVNQEEKIADLELDSIQFVEFIIQIENHFEIEFPIEKMDLSLIGNLSEFASLVEELHNIKRLKDNNRGKNETV